MHKNNKINQFLRFNVWLVLFLCFQITANAQDTSPSYVYEICDKVNNPNSQVGNLSEDSLASLPIGIRKEIAGTTYIIAIDSAEFTPEGAYFNAYMAMDFPGCDERIAFAAKHIKFNPKGVLGGEQAKLALVSEHRIGMGPNTTLYLPKDGSNYVEWDCNGFKAVNLHGSFLFNGEKLQPVSDADTVVAADFEVHVTDIHNMMTTVSINPFEVVGLDDFAFTVTEATVDMSDFNNPQNITFPEDYQGMDVGSPNLWRGFYIRNFVIKLPEKLNKDGQDDMTIFGQHMIIDDAGVSGIFGATSLFSTNEGSADGWAFSIDLLSVGLTASQLTAGTMNGEIGVPALKNQKLEYGAMLTVNPADRKTKYDFSLGITNDIVKSMQILKADLTIKNTSKLTMSSDAAGRFKPQLVLNGNLTLDYDNLELNELAFEHITFVTTAPFLTDGLFSLTSSNDSVNSGPNKMGKFPVSLTHLQFGVLNTQPSLGVGVALNLGNNPNGISVATDVFMKMNIEQNAYTGKQDWSFDGFKVNTIEIGLFTSAFTFEGLVNFRNDDPIYGKGFSGSFELGIPAVFSEKIYMACAFGKVDDFKYWMVDTRIPILIQVGPVTITSISGGLAYHMAGSKSVAELIEDAKDGSVTSEGESSMDYIPNQEMGIIFKTGVGFKAGSEKALNGDVVFSIAFNSNGGLNNIQLTGQAYMMCSRANRETATKYVKGSVSIMYDNQQKIFDLNASLTAQFGDALTGSLWTKLYVSPDLWYFWLGRPDNPATVSVKDIGSVNAYFMLGQNLLPMPPPPPEVSSVFGQIGSQRSTGDIATGNGVALGVNFNAGFDTGFNITDRLGIYGSGYAGAGFDMTLFKYGPTTHCDGSSADEFGMNHWYLQGQVYAYMGLDFGCTWQKLNGEVSTFNIMTANAAMLMQGKLPKPTFVYGGVHLDASFLGGIVEVDVTAEIEFGEDCDIVN